MPVDPPRPVNSVKLTVVVPFRGMVAAPNVFCITTVWAIAVVAENSRAPATKFILIRLSKFKFSSD